MDVKKRKITLSRANLLRSTRIFSKMNPFVKLITKKQEYRSSISKAAEKQPVWNYTQIIEVDDGEDIKLQILDFNSRAEPELIAETILNSKELLGCILKKDVKYSNQVVGQIELEIQNKTNILDNYVQRIQQINDNGIQKDLGPQFQYP
ncbi:unnamed protein product [Paramecium pentaurelia]|uniref:C2 domain-containing protein n=1 Tax=Paramecium pentaurelia TaxID=43138 RepID=A0A8S1SBZ5_9CILI|nr:unnamed protein product [Paramecium pentaurelia]